MTIGSTGGLWLSLGPLGTWPINFINLIASTIILGTSFGLPQALVLLYTKRRFSSYPLSILQIRFWLGVWVVAGALLTPGIVLFNTGGIIGAGMIVILGEWQILKRSVQQANQWVLISLFASIAGFASWLVVLGMLIYTYGSSQTDGRMIVIAAFVAGIMAYAFITGRGLVRLFRQPI